MILCNIKYKNECLKTMITVNVMLLSLILGNVGFRTLYAHVHTLTHITTRTDTFKHIIYVFVKLFEQLHTMQTIFELYITQQHDNQPPVEKQEFSKQILGRSE